MGIANSGRIPITNITIDFGFVFADPPEVSTTPSEPAVTGELNQP